MLLIDHALAEAKASGHDEKSMWKVIFHNGQIMPGTISRPADSEFFTLTTNVTGAPLTFYCDPHQVTGLAVL
jgi:hypothetical protein